MDRILNSQQNSVCLGLKFSAKLFAGAPVPRPTSATLWRSTKILEIVFFLKSEVVHILLLKKGENRAKAVDRLARRAEVMTNSWCFQFLVH